ncbi:hypothetical protein DK28_0205510 [Peptococcaceae bacterium SCADC1_2_3]|jgi:N-acetylmuramoyl-L-alanine amidase|nr:hypothetical protein DK28_0205510 [Peptococcaceae bacterium SCADC1_2_3]KFI36199.1 hypothetical protein HY00_06205 [Peptococcaceae bacterium SCADC1_2_3]HBQ28107.1 N-acetylmuramoyl-L-alanine amidase [Desulfotomaculum sp.]HCJ78447.1 N-acetylmuramoyl-L-alanine amidase [Desulfotomaculum sp.]
MPKILVLDPGHGGEDPGAVGKTTGKMPVLLKEKDLTLKLAKVCAEKLAPYDLNVKFTREDDRYVSLYERANIANRLKADYFCSIHINAGGGTGFESYVHSTAVEKHTDELRAILHDQIMAYLKKINVKEHGQGKKAANFAVLRSTAMPAVLLECLFIDTSTDAEKLADESFLQGLANEMAYGLARVLNLV